MAKELPKQQVEMTEELAGLIGEWYEASKKAKAADEAENAARMAVYNKLHEPGETIRSQPGTERFEMPGNWVLEVERRRNCRIDKPALTAVIEAFKAMPVDRETGEIPSLDGVIRFDPKLSDAGYRDMAPHLRTILDEALTFSEGTPGMKLEYKPPKGQVKAKAKDGEGV